ncbi:MAG: hypothetical protein RBU21_00235 [FCB group bacterium]|nr:hypothetical protein [FCB group bacterium]
MPKAIYNTSETATGKNGEESGVLNTLFSLVVVGHMNPPIHHPTWYRVAGLISEADEATALALPDTICTSQTSQFNLASINIQCHLNRWQAQSNEATAEKKILDLAADLFDDRLPHTPVTAFGFNFHSDVEGTAVNVPQVLGEAFQRSLQCLDEEADVKAVLLMADIESPLGTFRIHVNTSQQGNNVISFVFNYEYQVAKMVPGVAEQHCLQFSLRRFLEDRHPIDARDACERRQRIMNSLR